MLVSRGIGFSPFGETGEGVCPCLMQGNGEWENLTLIQMIDRRVRLSLPQSAQESMRHIPFEIEISI